MATLLLSPSDPNVSRRDLNIFTMFRLLKVNPHVTGIDYCRRRREGEILIKFLPEHESSEKAMLRLTQINQIPVTVTAPAHLNVIKGVITHPEMAYMNEEDVHEMLEDQGVIFCKKQPESATSVIGWKVGSYSSPPLTVKLGWDTVKVRTYVPRPVRCFNCQELGHVAEQCESEQTCSFCCETHKLEDCTYRKIEESYCMNCQEYGHPSTSKKCPEWKKQCGIQKIKKQEKKTYSEAAKEYDKRNKKEEPPEQENSEEKKKEDAKKNEDNKKKEDGTEDTEKNENTKKKEDVTTQEKSTEEQERRPQAKRKTEENTEAFPTDQSGVKTDLPGGWQTVTSRKKKK